MSDIEKLIELTFCSREDAEAAFAKTGNLQEALYLLMNAPAPKKERSQQQKFFDTIRTNLAGMEERNAEVLNANRLVGSAPDEKQTHPEETSQQKSCSPECQPDVQVSEAGKQETDGP